MDSECHVWMPYVKALVNGYSNKYCRYFYYCNIIPWKSFIIMEKIEFNQCTAEYGAVWRHRTIYIIVNCGNLSAIHWLPGNSLVWDLVYPWYVLIKRRHLYDGFYLSKRNSFIAGYCLVLKYLTNRLQYLLVVSLGY